MSFRVKPHAAKSVLMALALALSCGWAGSLALAADAPDGMVLIPEGPFLMGDHYGLQPQAVPVREVHVSAFYMGKYPVTYELWRKVHDWAVENGYDFDNPGHRGSHGEGDNMPVTRINWYDCAKWANAFSEMEGRTPAYYTDIQHTQVYRTGRVDLINAQVKWDAEGYRMPTEAEWEKAARGGLEGHHFPWPSRGRDYMEFIDGGKANYHESGRPFEGTTPVGYYDGNQTPAGPDMANGYGLYDMAGNVWERIWDWYCDEWYYRPESSQPDPRGPEFASPYPPRGNIGRVGRGGRWYGPNARRYPSHVVDPANPSIADLRCATRLGRLPHGRSSNYGLRLAMTAPQPEDGE